MHVGNSAPRTDEASRVIAASPDSIYGAFTSAQALMSWLPPQGMTGKALELDAREGGRYRIELTYVDAAGEGRGKSTGRTDVTQGRFVQMVPGRRIQQSVEFESDDAAFAGEMTMTWSFEPHASGTLVTVTATNVPDGIKKEDHDQGLCSSLENLARFVEPGR